MRCVSRNVRGLRHPHRGGGGVWSDAISREWGADVICLQETLLTGTDHRIWSNFVGRRGIASMRQCHVALRRSYARLEGDLIRQHSGMVRATCSCSTPPPASKCDSICVCISIWTYGSHDPGGTMGGFDTAVRGFPEPPCAQWRGFQCDAGGCRPAK